MACAEELMNNYCLHAGLACLQVKSQKTTSSCRLDCVSGHMHYGKVNQSSGCPLDQTVLPRWVHWLALPDRPLHTGGTAADQSRSPLEEAVDAAQRMALQRLRQVPTTQLRGPVFALASLPSLGCSRAVSHTQTTTLQNEIVR